MTSARPIDAATRVFPPHREGTATHHGGSAAGTFVGLLAEAMGGLRVSQHAQQRLRSAGLHTADLEAVGRAVAKVAAKGGRESLVVYGDTAFLVSVRNRTLITVVPAARMREQVFTNIDSAVLLAQKEIPSGAGPSREAAGEGRA